MKQNTTVETAQNSQTTNNNTTGKVKTLKNAQDRKKEREEQYRNFRINALKRRCKRYGLSEEQTKTLIERLKQLMDAPKEYSILIMMDRKDGPLMKEALANAKINYLYHGDTYFYLQGTKDVVDKIREIAPPKAKIQMYSLKSESVLKDIELPPKEKKKPTNNTAEKKAAAKVAKLGNRCHGSKRWIHRRQKGRIVDAEGNLKPMRVHASDFFMKGNKKMRRRKPSPRPNRGTNPTKVKIGKRAWLKANTTQAILSLSEHIAKQKAITVQLKAKNGSTGKEKASTSVKKAA